MGKSSKYGLNTNTYYTPNLTICQVNILSKKDEEKIKSRVWPDPGNRGSFKKLGKKRYTDAPGFMISGRSRESYREIKLKKALHRAL